MTETPPVLWTPSEERVRRAAITRFAAAVGRPGASYDDLWRWSVEHLEEFWAAVWDFCQVQSSTPYDAVLGSRDLPGAQWFPGARLNYAEHALRRGTEEHPAIVFVAEGAEPVETSWAALRRAVAGLAASLRAMGVRPGDRVVGYLPNVPQTVVAFLATASVGAVWSSCSPDFGTRSVVDRFAQIEPRVLIAADGYRWGGKVHDRRDVVAELREALPTVEHVVVVPYAFPADPVPTGATSYDDLVRAEGELVFEQVPFDSPLWVLYSSGTTGLPKGIVHGHGGITVELLKVLTLHFDLEPGSRFFWYTTTSWMMWNTVVSALLVGATIVLYDGSPGWPDLAAQWRLAEQTGVTYFGTSAGYLLSCMKAQISPGDFDLSTLQAVGSTGSPLPASGFRWFYDSVKGDVQLGSGSGGTDVCTGFVGGAPTLPVWEGEISGRNLGVAVEAWSEDGRPLVGEVGELVVTAPMPSMPLRFWGDPDGARYRAAYFDMFPGVWRHGDWLEITERGSCLVSGRSDSTLNRMGVRMGSADIYAAVESLPEVAEALVVGVEEADGGYYMPLFVALAPGATLDDALRRSVVSVIRESASPRHVPDEIVAVPGIPHTRTGKKLEVPVKKLLQGGAVETSVQLGAVDDPALVEHLASFAAARQRGMSA